MQYELCNTDRVMISVASSIKFYKADGLLPSFDNTQFNDRTDKGVFRHTYRQKLYDDDTVTLQVKVTNGYTIDLYYSLNCYGPWTKLSSGTKEVDGSSYDYWQVTVAMSTFAADSVQFKLMIYNTVPTLSQTWYSEPVALLTEDDEDLLQFDFFNVDNANEVDYSTAIAHMLRVEANIREYRAGGSTSVFDNQDEITRINSEIKRIFVLKTEPIPAYLSEMLHVAVKMDKFFVNEVEFVAESEPEIDGAGSMTVFTCNLTQRSVIGLNTHDIGYDADTTTNSETMVLQSLAASGQISFTVPEGYLILTITGYRTAGSPVIKAGTTVGGDDILLGMSLNATAPIWEVAAVPNEIAPTGDATLYVDISGVGAKANIYVLLVKNRQ